MFIMTCMRSMIVKERFMAVLIKVSILITIITGKCWKILRKDSFGQRL